jgi:MFS family permease
MAPSNFVLLCVIYTFIYAGGGTVGVFMPVLLSMAGLSPEQVGLVSASSPIAGIFGVLLLGWLFDRKREWRKRIYVAASACAFAVYLTVPLVVILLPAHAFSLCIVAVMLAAAISSAAGTLLDAISIEATQQNEYGRLRLFGAVGYGLAAGVMGVILYLAHPADGSWQLWLWHYGPAVVTNCVGLGTALFLKPVREEKTPTTTDSSTASESEKQQLTVQSDAENITPTSLTPSIVATLSASTIVSLVLFSLVVTVCGLASGVINSFLFVFLATLPEGSGLIQGLSVTVTTAFEIPVFFFSKSILERVSVEWLVCVSLVAYCLRILSYFLFALYRPLAYYALFSETLHGLTFALLWAATVARAQALVKAGISRSGMSMAVASGLSAIGRAGGSFGAGAALTGGRSWAQVWLVALGCMGGILVVWTVAAGFLTGCRLKKKGQLKGL